MKINYPTRILDRHVGGNHTYNSQLAHGLLLRGHEIGRVPAGRRAAATAALETAYALRKSRNPSELVHYTADTGPIVKPRMPSVLTVHGVASRHVRVARNPRQQAVWNLRVKAALRAIDQVITVSQSSAKDIVEEYGIDPVRVQVIHHGIDHTHSEDAGISSAVADVINGPPFLLYTGNIEPRKNVDGLVDAYRLARDLNSSFRLVIAGRPAWNFAETMAKIGQAPNVVYLGFVTDTEKRALFSACDLFVFPSFYEGFGLPVLEAMREGAPVLTSDRGSLAEVAGPSFTVRDLTASGIAQALRDALGSPEALRRARVDGPAWTERFRWKASIDRHEETYRKVLEQW